MKKFLLILAILVGFSTNAFCGTETLDQSQTTISATIGFHYAAAANLQLGQSFTAGNSNYLTKCSLGLKRVGTKSGTMWVELYATSGGLVTGSALATSDTISFNSLSTSAALQDFTFSGANRYKQTSGTMYALVAQISDTTVDGTNYYESWGTASDSYASGSWQRKESGSWNNYAAAYDNGFRTYTTDVIADPNAGFLNLF